MKIAIPGVVIILSAIVLIIAIPIFRKQQQRNQELKKENAALIEKNKEGQADIKELYVRLTQKDHELEGAKQKNKELEEEKNDILVQFNELERKNNDLQLQVKGQSEQLAKINAERSQWIHMQREKDERIAELLQLNQFLYEANKEAHNALVLYPLYHTPQGGNYSGGKFVGKPSSNGEKADEQSRKNELTTAGFFNFGPGRWEKELRGLAFAFLCGSGAWIIGFIIIRRRKKRHAKMVSSIRTDRKLDTTSIARSTAA